MRSVVLGSLITLAGCTGDLTIGPDSPSIYVLEVGTIVHLDPGDANDQVISDSVGAVEWTIGQAPDASVLLGIPEPEGFEAERGELHLFYEAVGPGYTVLSLGLQEVRQSGNVVAGGLTYSFTVE